MINIFNDSHSFWVRYSSYELKKDSKGESYIVPAEGAKPDIIDILEDPEQLVLDALNTAATVMKNGSDKDSHEDILTFAEKYGLLGMMAALPTTPNFMIYDSVYLPKNRYIREETMSAGRYTDLFFPFGKPELHKSGGSACYSIENDKEQAALALTFGDVPIGQTLCVHKDYAEPYEWVEQQFRDWAFIFFTAYFYYEDKATLDEGTENMFRQAMKAFDGAVPTYHIELHEKPVLVWDFHSLALCIQMMFSFALTDEDSELRICKNCGRVFTAKTPGAEFCSRECGKT